MPRHRCEGKLVAPLTSEMLESRCLIKADLRAANRRGSDDASDDWPASGGPMPEIMSSKGGAGSSSDD